MQRSPFYALFATLLALLPSPSAWAWSEPHHAITKAALAALRAAGLAILLLPIIGWRGMFLPAATPPEALTALVKSDGERWAKVVVDAKIPRE